MGVAWLGRYQKMEKDLHLAWISRDLHLALALMMGSSGTLALLEQSKLWEIKTNLKLQLKSIM